jgi:hypothetical protein
MASHDVVSPPIHDESLAICQLHVLVEPIFAIEGIICVSAEAVSHICLRPFLVERRAFFVG